MAGPVNLDLEREEREFHDMMARNVTRLMDFAKPWVGRMTNRGRKYFLAKAIDIAWQRRAEFNPKRQSILLWWRDCLKAAALSRSEWHLLTIDDVEVVSGEKLSRGIR